MYCLFLLSSVVNQTKNKKLLSFNIWILIVKYTKETKIHLSHEMSLSFLGPSDSRIIMTSFIVPHVCSLIVFAKSIEQIHNIINVENLSKYLCKF